MEYEIQVLLWDFFIFSWKMKREKSNKRDMEIEHFRCCGFSLGRGRDFNEFLDPENIGSTL
jgi:hypothetical protein